MKVENRTFIISGGTSGLGKGAAQLLTQHDAYVALFDLADNQDVVSQLPGGRAKFFKVDVTSTSDIQEAVDATVQWTKETNAPLGGVVASAGIAAPAKIMDSSYEPLNIEVVQEVINVNLIGTINLIRLTVPHLARVEPSTDAANEGERGIVIMVSSSSAYDGQPGQIAYAASKGAIRSLTLPLARDLSRYGIRAVSIAPNIFVTGMTAMMSEKLWNSLKKTLEWPPRPGRPEEFGQLVLDICRNPMLNGDCIRLDGGSRLASRI